MKPYSMLALLAVMAGVAESMQEFSVRNSPKNWTGYSGSTREQERRLKQAKRKEQKDVRKYYEMIAEELRFAWAQGDPTQAELNNLAEGMTRKFAQDNPRFDLIKFLNSCGCYRKDENNA